MIDGGDLEGDRRPRSRFRPEDGIEVVATGKLTTYPGRSRYQIVIERLELAGQGALMALLDKRRRALAAEGLFDAERKQTLPFLPRVIGVVTSPTGAVIRDILHRLADRCPCHVIVWPVPVQGEGAAAQIAAAVRGFNALAAGGAIARPDLLIVARGGGSIEDLWAFNEEEVVRAVAGSDDPDHLRGRPRDRHHACAISPPTCARRRRPPRPRWRCRCAATCSASCASSAAGSSAAPAARVERGARAARGAACAAGPSARPCSRRSGSGSTTSPSACRAALRDRLEPRPGRARPGRRRASAGPARGAPIARASERLDALWRVAQLAHPNRPLERGYARVEDRDGKTLISAAAARAAGAAEADLRRRRRRRRGRRRRRRSRGRAARRLM